VSTEAAGDAPLRIVFMGTPAFALPALDALVGGRERVVGVVTQPDRPRGRRLGLRPSPVKEFCLRHGLPVLQPKSLKDARALDDLGRWEPDLIVVAAYGKILPRPVLDLPRHGCVNAHASLLPKYRGAAPIQWAILRGETRTGVTIMRMNERMDAGDILLTKTVEVGPDETAKTLHDRLARLAAEALLEAIALLKRGELRPTPQRESEATFAPAIRKEDGRIDWTRPAADIERMVRAFDPWPSAYTSVERKHLKIVRARVADAAVSPASASPGQVLRAGPKELLVSTGEGVLGVLEVQLEGKRRLPVADFLKGHPVKEGTRLGAEPSGKA
jgi:methionyl-tRNA formyltransferase